MRGIIAEGEEVALMTGFYNCNNVLRGDVVAYHYAGNDSYVVKQVRGIPGDSIQLEKNDSSEWSIVVNKEKLKTVSGQSYSLRDSQKGLLESYIESYKGTLPEDAYLLLGTSAFGSADSTQFGFIGRKDIAGKIVIP